MKHDHGRAKSHTGIAAAAAAAVVMLGWFPSPLQAHPIPDVPVRAFFSSDGKTRIEIEVDPRCFLEDPESELYTLYWYLQRCDEDEKNEMREGAREFIPTRVEMIFDPPGEVPEPEYVIDFTTHDGNPLEKLDDPVVMRATWEFQMPSSVKTYQVKAHEVGILSVLAINHVDDLPQENWMTLFPGEESGVLELPQQRSPFLKPLIFGAVLLVAFLCLRFFQRKALGSHQRG